MPTPSRLRTLCSALVLCLLPAAAVQAATRAPAPAPIEVLVLGTYHMDNPGRDLNNLEADDVRTPARQAQIESVARALARFKPTRIALEFVSDEPGRIVKRYAAFTPADLNTARDERVQLGFRLARELGHAEVYGIDEQSETVDYFPFDRVMDYAKRTGRDAELAVTMGYGADFVARMARIQTRGSVRDLLVWLNDPATVQEGYTNGYLESLHYGAGREFPGAELNAAWYLRNAKIHAKLIEIARPGDRVLVLFGAGHAYWLRHFARETPGFRLVEANAYLKGAR